MGNDDKRLSIILSGLAIPGLINQIPDMISDLVGFAMGHFRQGIWNHMFYSIHDQLEVHLVQFKL